MPYNDRVIEIRWADNGDGSFDALVKVDGVWQPFGRATYDNRDVASMWGCVELLGSYFSCYDVIRESAAIRLLDALMKDGRIKPDID